MHFGESNTQQVSMAQQLIAVLSSTTPIPHFGNCTCQKPEYAINEATEDFFQKNVPVGMYVCNNKEVYFVNEPLLSPEQQKLTSSGKKTKIPLVLSIEFGPNPIRANIHPIVLEQEFAGTEELQRGYSN